MEIVAIGLNHHKAPVEVRAQVTPLTADVETALSFFAQHEQTQRNTLLEGAIISTCNRLEIYAMTDACTDGFAALVAFLSERSGLPSQTLEQYLDYYQDEAVVTHLFTVACGLDSQVVGENEILGQVRDAYELARDTKAAGTVLLKLFRRAVTVGKRARTNTAISRNAASVSSVAVALAKQQFPDLSRKRALVIGSGEMGQQALRNLVNSGVDQVTVSNRTRVHAEMTAAQYNGQVADFDHLEDALAEADIVISSTSAPHAVLHADQVQKAMADRTDRPLVLIDIAMPPDVDPEVADIHNVFLYNLDDLGTVVQTNLGRRRQEVPKVEALVEEETAQFMSWIRSLDMLPTIVALRRHADLICEAEVRRAMRRLGEMDDEQREVIEAMAKALTKKLLHTPTMRLKERACDQSAEQYSQILQDLFDLHPHECI